MSAKAIDAPTWVNGKRACDLSGLARHKLYRMGMVGAIRVRLDPGQLPLYHLEDVLRAGREWAANKAERAGV